MDERSDQPVEWESLKSLNEFRKTKYNQPSVGRLQFATESWSKFSPSFDICITTNLIFHFVEVTSIKVTDHDTVEILKDRGDLKT